MSVILSELPLRARTFPENANLALHFGNPDEGRLLPSKARSHLEAQRVRPGLEAQKGRPRRMVPTESLREAVRKARGASSRTGPEDIRAHRRRLD